MECQAPDILEKKAVDICISGAWEMGTSVISIIHVPEVVYLEMFKALVELNNDNPQLIENFIEFSTKDDENFNDRINGGDYDTLANKNEIFKWGNEINYDYIKNKIIDIKRSYNNSLSSDINPCMDTFFKGIAAYTLMREKAYPINYEKFIGRRDFIKNLV